MQTRNVMVDLETLSTAPNAAILSIGAVKFEPGVPVTEASDSFHVGIEPQRFPPQMFDVDPKTVAWWMSPEQNDARRAWVNLHKVSLGEALASFSVWLWDGLAQDHGDRVLIWGNGAAFDNVILRHAFEVHVGEAPWSYRDDRCYRTLAALVPEMEDPRKMTAAFGVRHTALADALAQAWCASPALAWLANP